MRELELVTLKYPTKLQPGVYVVPVEDSGLNFKIGIVKEYKGGEPYAKISIDGEDVNCVFLKLQAIKLYLVNKEAFSPGDWYYTPAKEKPKKGALFGRYESSISRINTELDAKLHSLGDNKKIIYKPDSIGLMRADFERFDTEIGSLIPLTSSRLNKILGNGGKCWVEDQLVENKVVIHEKHTR